MKDFHHIPPQHPALRTPIHGKLVDKRDHEAYNRLFQNAANPEQCFEILLRDWWPGYSACWTVYPSKEKR